MTSTERQLAVGRIYDHSARGRARKRRYQTSEKGRLKERRRCQSETYKDRIKRTWKDKDHTPLGRARRKRANRAYYLRTHPGAKQ